MNGFEWNWEDLTHGRAAGKTAADGLDDGELGRPDILAREITQNAIDASDYFKHRGFKDHAPRLIYRYREFAGPSKKSLVELLGLDQIRAHAPFIKSRQGDVLENLEVLQDLEDFKKPIRVLIAEDYGAHGLYGDKWKIALRGAGISHHDEGHQSGGTFGFGKGAFHLGSSLSMVVAYSRFPFDAENPDPYNWQARVGAYLYQNSHNDPETGKILTGFAEAGRTAQDTFSQVTEPFEGEVAIELAPRLGLEREIIEGVNAFGTSFMMIDPVVEPEDLRKSIEKSWWPALIDGDIAIDVIDTDGSSLPPRPRSRDDLKPFVEAWSWFKGVGEPSGDYQRLKKLNRKTIQGEALQMGQVALWADPEEAFSFSDEDEERASEVALIRQRKMVVNYQKYSKGRPPYVQGILFTDPDIEDYVKGAEPKLHDYWWQNTRDVKPHFSEDYKSVIQGLATATYNNVREFRSDLNPRIDQDSIRLEKLSRLLGNMLKFSSKGGAGDPVRGNYEPFSIGLAESEFTQRELSSGERIYGAKLRVRLTDEFAGDYARVRVGAIFNITEDAGSKGALVPTRYLEVPDGWEQDGAYLYGNLTKAELCIHVETEEIGGPFGVLVRAETAFVEEGQID